MSTDIHGIGTMSSQSAKYTFFDIMYYFSTLHTNWQLDASGGFLLSQLRHNSFDSIAHTLAETKKAVLTKD